MSLVFKSLMVFSTSFLAGILIDIDHILDYYLQNKITFKIKEFYNWCMSAKFEFLFIFLHSIELIVLFWVIITIFRLGLFWIAFAVGLTQHMFLDIVFNRGVYSRSYFLSYRIIKGFRAESLLRSKYR